MKNNSPSDAFTRLVERSMATAGVVRPVIRSGFFPPSPAPGLEEISFGSETPAPGVESITVPSQAPIPPAVPVSPIRRWAGEQVLVPKQESVGLQSTLEQAAQGKSKTFLPGENSKSEKNRGAPSEGVSPTEPVHHMSHQEDVTPVDQKENVNNKTHVNKISHNQSRRKSTDAANGYNRNPHDIVFPNTGELVPTRRVATPKPLWEGEAREILTQIKPKVKNVGLNSRLQTGQQPVQVTIGRLDIRAVLQQPAPPQPPLPEPKPALSLDDYLRKRDGGKL